MNPQAISLNEVISKKNPALFELLSEKGQKIFFPAKGILGQSADAKGKKINATIGAAIEDDGMPMHLSVLQSQLNIDASKAFPYAPSFGRPDIRAKWREMIYAKNPSLNGIEISNPIVSNALTHGLSIAAYMLLNPNDTLLVSDLFWGNYNLAFSNAFNAKIDKFKLFSESGGFNLDAFKAKLNNLPKQKKVVLLNFPNNPTGYTPTSEEVTKIVQVLKADAESGSNIAVICDDAYFGLVYEEGVEKESIFAHLSNLHENILAVKVDGPTKEDYVWGFRVGFITYAIKGGDSELYAALEQKTGGAVRGNISNACNLSQSLLLNAYNHENYDKEKAEKYAIMKGRYDKVKEVLSDTKYSEFFKPLPYNSGYFMCIQLNDPLDAENVRNTLLEKYDTGVIAIGKVLRIAFSAVAEKDVQLLFENIYNACKDQ